MRTTNRLRALAALLICLPASLAAADFWARPGDPGVVTNNDCGFVSAVAGTPRIRRSFMADTEQVPIYLADRLGGGDEFLPVPPGRVEMITCDNLILVVGTASRAVLGGVRVIAGGSAGHASRLDAALLAGRCRVQARRNEEHPEAALITVAGHDVLVTRGDAEIAVEGGWRVSVLAGEVVVRDRKGGGQRLLVAAGYTAGPGGVEPLTDEDAAAIRARLPFSFETERAALPPLPPMSALLEAP